MSKLKPCPFGKDHKVWIGVHDDDGNYHGAIGCEYVDVLLERGTQ